MRMIYLAIFVKNPGGTVLATNGRPPMANNPIVLVMACQRDRDSGLLQALRQTCYANSKVEYRFFLGNQARTDVVWEDEVRLDVSDDYDSLPWKSQAAQKWAAERGYDWTLKVDSDTYVYTSRLQVPQERKHTLPTGDEIIWPADYVGHFWNHPEEQDSVIVMPNRSYASGGAGYWSSPSLRDKIISTPVTYKIEDVWVGAVASAHRIDGRQDLRYYPGHRFAAMPDQQLHTFHLDTQDGKLDTRFLYELRRSE
jgi:hypothetical protein